MKLRKLSVFVICIAFVFAMTPVAAEDDYSDTAYWTNLCTDTSNMSPETQQACKGYLSYMTSQSKDLQSQISSIDSQREDIAANIEEYVAKIDEYQKQIDSLQSQIDDLQSQIDDLETQIDAKQKEIDEQQEKADQLKSKVSQQVASSQTTMRVSKYIDILMGAKTFEDFLIRADCLATITEYNHRVLNQYVDAIDKLNTAKDELAASQKTLESTQSDLKDKQTEILAAQYEAQVIQEEYQKQEAELIALRAETVSNIDEIQAKMKEVSSALNSVAASAGWTYPVPGAKLSAGTWAYPGGGWHAGEDFGANVSYGSTYAVACANGVVLMARDAGCGYGHLGDYCPGNGGGNQILLLVVVNGETYGVLYLHFLTGSFSVSTGQTVSAGQRLALTGSSGNSTGPHTHVEVFHVGSASQFSSIAQNWNGDIMMGSGWTQSTTRKCEDGYGVPCKIRPETLFGTGW